MVKIARQTKDGKRTNTNLNFVPGVPFNCVSCLLLVVSSSFLS